MDKDIPLFVKDLLKQEINNIKLNLLKKISEDYDIDEDELKERYACDVEMISKSLENVEITKKHKYGSKVPNDMRCNARVWNKGSGGRCKRSINKNKLCTLHNRYIEKNGKLKYGLITEKKSKEVFKFKNPKSEKLY